MTTNIKFETESKPLVLSLLKTAENNGSILVLTDNDNDHMVIATLMPKTFLGTITQAISDELCLNDDDQITDIELCYRKHNYSIECKCSCVIDGEEEEREYNINATYLYK